MRLFGLSVDSGFDSELDKKCFDSFFNDGANHLSTFRPISQAFWTVLLPQLSQLHLSLRHSIIALSLINEPLCNGVVAKVAHYRRADLLDSIISHYNKAIRGFASMAGSMTTESKLASCIVFVALTVYLDRTAASTTHSLAAFRFLQEYELRIKSGLLVRDRVIADTFIPVVKKCLIDACIFMNAGQQLSNFYTNPLEGWIDDFLTVPAIFASFENAWECLANLLKCAVASSQEVMPFSEVAKFRLQQALRNFVNVVQSSNLQSLSGRELPPAQINTHLKGLLLHHRAITVLSRCHLSMKESEFEIFISDFEKIFHQTLDVLQTEQFQSWRIGLGFMPPLFLVATKCRSSALRHQALHLLHRTRRIERCWTSCMAYTLAKFVVDLEEASAQDSLKIAYLSRNYIRLESLELDPQAQVANIRFTIQKGDQASGPFQAQVPCPIDIALNQTAVKDLITPPVLKASGYSGILLCTGAIACNCAYDETADSVPILSDGPTVADYPWLRHKPDPNLLRKTYQEHAYSSKFVADQIGQA